jgi:hypothetical protein
MIARSGTVALFTFSSFIKLRCLAEANTIWSVTCTYRHGQVVVNYVSTLATGTSLNVPVANRESEHDQRTHRNSFTIYSSFIHSPRTPSLSSPHTTFTTTSLSYPAKSAPLLACHHASRRKRLDNTNNNSGSNILESGPRPALYRLGLFTDFRRLCLFSSLCAMKNKRPSCKFRKCQCSLKTTGVAARQ